MILVGNKADLDHERVVSDRKGGGLDPQRRPCHQGVGEGYESEGQECIPIILVSTKVKILTCKNTFDIDLKTFLFFFYNK